jgi:hypothetical protein
MSSSSSLQEALLAEGTVAKDGSGRESDLNRYLLGNGEEQVQSLKQSLVLLAKQSNVEKEVGVE